MSQWENKKIKNVACVWKLENRRIMKKKKKSYMRVGTGRQKNDESDNNNEACTVNGVCECYDSCV